MPTIPPATRIFAVTLALLVVFTPGAAGESRDFIEDQTLRYAAFYNGLDAGEAAITIRNEKDGYRVTSTVKPSMLAAMFFKAHTSETRFIRRDGNVYLDGGVERLAGEDGYRRAFRVDRTGSRVEFTGGERDGEQTPIEPGEWLEAAAFPLLLMLRPLERIAGARVREVGTRRTRAYVYEAPVAETVRVPAGEFPSWKITRHRTDRPADSVSVWLRKPAGGADAAETPKPVPIPLKIVVTRKGGSANSRTSTLLLRGKQP